MVANLEYILLELSKVVTYQWVRCLNRHQAQPIQS